MFVPRAHADECHIRGRGLNAVISPLVLLPGNHCLKYGPSPNAARVDYELTVGGVVDFAPVYDSVLSGRGTGRLTLDGTQIDIDV